MPNAWVEFVRQYAKENNLSYGCSISEASPAYRKMKQDKKSTQKVRDDSDRLRLTGNNQEIAQQQLRGIVINGDRNYETQEEFYPDVENLEEMNKYLRIWEERRGKRNENEVERTIKSVKEKINELQKKKKKRITIKPKIKKSNPKSQPKMNKSNPYDIIISNWDDDYLNVLIDQELPKLGENIERIAERKTLNDDLLLSLFPKEIIEGVLNIGGVEYLSKGLDIIIDNYNGKSFYPDWTLKKGSFPEKLRIRILQELEGVNNKL